MKKALILTAVLALAFGSNAYAATLTLSTRESWACRSATFLHRRSTQRVPDGNDDAYRAFIANKLLDMGNGEVWTDPTGDQPRGQAPFLRLPYPLRIRGDLSGGVNGTGNVLPVMYQYVLPSTTGPMLATSCLNDNLAERYVDPLNRWWVNWMEDRRKSTASLAGWLQPRSQMVAPFRCSLGGADGPRGLPPLCQVAEFRGPVLGEARRPLASLFLCRWCLPRRH